VAPEEASAAEVLEVEGTWKRRRQVSVIGLEV
jgi:hypothetical protein